MTPQWQDAASRGDVELLRHLIAEGADVDAKEQHSQTALMIAARGGRTSVIEDQEVRIDNKGKIAEYLVRMRVTFVLKS